MKNAAGFLVVFGCTCVLASHPGPRTLTFEERVRAQGAIERVYYTHQVGATTPFETAVPQDVLERKVRTYLKQSVALERFWKTPITALMLQRERERMETSTRMPERLRELYASLNEDSFLIEECLVRATLADRLAHNFFAYDERFQGEARARALALQKQLMSGEVDPLAEHPQRTLLVGSSDGTADRAVTPRQGERAAQRARDVVEVSIPPDEFERWAADLVGEAESAGAVVEDTDSFGIKMLLDRDSDRIRVAVFRIDKRSWDDWWDVSRQSLDELSVTPVASGGSDTAFSPSSLACPADDTWDAGSLSAIPVTVPDRHHTAVWTGTEMVVWGSAGAFGTRGRTAGKYNPETDTWAAASTGISGRIHHTAIWTGSQMIVWGGYELDGIDQLGSRYDPATNTWASMSTVNAPAARESHTAVWSGTRMIVWGGREPFGGQAFNSGGRYDPMTDTWSATSTTNAPSPRTEQTAVWTGTRMIVWGGYDNPTYFSSGGRYDPITDTWSATSTVNAPQARRSHAAVWSGSAMVVWGGLVDDIPSPYRNTGGRYDPTTDTWSATSTTNAPLPRTGHTAVWTGSEMVVWGGFDGSSPNFNVLITGGRYNPVSDTWSATSTVNTVSDGRFHSAVWTGSRMIVWRGRRGARYVPGTDTWTPIASAPTSRRNHGAVWTGNEMIVWAGDPIVGAGTNTGGRYNLVTDAWTFTSTGANVPDGRSDPSVVWTGSEMIVWGGGGSGEAGNTGARYNPISDTWSPTATLNAPSARVSHTLVWTGGAMIVWGGSDGSPNNNKLDTGGRYNPATDTWAPTSVTGAPSARNFHFAVWSGNRMVVWGGDANRTGGRYDPVTNTWSPTSTVNAPNDVASGAVWTGAEMLVLGSSVHGRYNPQADVWTVAAPLPSSAFGFSTFVWAGSRAVVWQGEFQDFRYNPIANAWTQTSTIGAPVQRRSHSAVWTGKWMIVWGGWDSAYKERGDGSRYAVTPDDDSDGFSACAGDCNDLIASVHPGATESCNAIDDNCNGQTDEDASGVDSDGDSVHNACDNCDLDWNATQSDFDHDNQGDMCDLNDGLIFVYSSNKNYREWQAEPGYTTWNSYRGSLAALRATGQYTQAPGSNPLAARNCGLTNAYVFDPLVPAAGTIAFNLVTGVAGGIESSLGTNSGGVPRANANPCP